ncbi:MAG: hypothetical protein IPK82_13510 [Polyangiaceae bacterium]|nr:hypothetical protein [Polyangiaceae bacterium]
MRAGQVVLGTLIVGGAAGASGCLERPLEPVGPRSTAVISERLTQSSVDKIDLVLSIDNSRSMADKQAILALAVPDLVKGLVNPGCVDPNTGTITSVPAGPLDKCPAGTDREFEPVLDIHVGIITSSLGGHGSDACFADAAGKQSNNDKGRLIARKDPALAEEVETYQNQKFLAWDPAQKLTPPGEADIESDSGADGNNTALAVSLSDMVKGAGQVGCGYEAQLESWYRFLVDPSPPEAVKLDDKGNVFLDGIDKVVLDQRKAFLRPDSLLAVIMLTDENDCSIREQGKYYYAAQQKSGNGTPFHLPKARAICDQNPNDQCCFSCGSSGPKDDNGNPVCPDDASCKDGNGNTIYYTDADLGDDINLRCWNQKRRFGIDFLYGVDRYVDAIRNSSVTDRNGSVVPNPLFSDLDPSDDNSNVRTANLIFLAGIVGVPWQDIARTNSSGAPDLKAGLDPDGVARGGFKTFDEMLTQLPNKDYNTWDVILGDPDNYPAQAALPKDPLMIESVDKRTGENPITGDPVVDAGNPLANKINGHEWSIPKRDDLQYACIFPLPESQNCATAGASCDCSKTNDSPLCEVDPGTGEPTIQVRAKAYPGIRELHVLKKAGSQGIVGSVCPAQLTKSGDVDFGYRPAIGAIIDRLKQALRGQCLSRTLVANPESGQVPCLILEASKVENNACDCEAAGRDPVSEEHQAAVAAIQSQNPESDFNCFCEITQLTNEKGPVTQSECQDNFNQSGYDLCACQYTPDGQPVNADGWCYVDETSGIGNPDVVKNCPSTERRLIRFAGAGEAKPGATLFITCTGDKGSE